MSARSGSLGWVVIAGGISIAVASAFWGLLDTAFVGTIVATDSWAAAEGSLLQQGREYVLTTWDWFLLIVLLRIGIEAIVASRLVGATTSLPFATLLVLAFHLFLVLFMLTIPEMADAVYQQAQSMQAVEDAGMMRAVDLAMQWGIGVLPAVLLLVADVWYLSSPIRNDMLAR
jgi:hypothetical protein